MVIDELRFYSLSLLVRVDRFISDEARSTHIQLNHQLADLPVEEQFVCEYCAKVFGRKASVRTHIRSIHFHEVLKKRKQCDICKKWLSSSGSLTAHMKRHVDGPQNCPKCDKVTANRTALDNHIRRFHVYKQRNKCQLCEKTFTSAKALQVSGWFFRRLVDFNGMSSRNIL